MIGCLSPNGMPTSVGDGPLDTLLVATLRGLYVLRRAAPDAPWTVEGPSLGHKHISSLAHEPQSGLLFAGIHGRGPDGGLFVTPDLGRTWEERMNGLNSSHVYCVSIQNRPEGVTLYAGTEPPALYRSRDMGRSWEDLAGLRAVPGTEKWIFPPPPHIAHVKNTTFDPHDPDTIYALVEQGAVLRSRDAGATWVELDTYSSADDSFYRDVHRLVVAPSDTRRLHLATGDGLYYSADDGKTWAHQQLRTDRVGYPDALFLDPRDDDVVYMCGAGDAPETWRQRDGAFPGFIVSRDRGKTWTERMNGIPQPVHGNIEATSMHSWPQGLAFYAGTAVGDVFATEDGGANWSKIAGGLPPISKARHYRHFLSAEEKLRIEDEARAERRAEGLAPKEYHGRS